MKQPANLESRLQPVTTPTTQPNAPQNQLFATTAIFTDNTPLPENETPLIINDLNSKIHETTGNEPENLESILEGLRKAFLQNQPLNPNYDQPQTTSKTARIPENETSLIINELDAQTHENTGNIPAKPATQENPISTPPLSPSPSPLLPLSDSPSPLPSPLPPKDNLIRQGEVFSRPVYITPSWPFREEPRGNKYKY